MQILILCLSEEFPLMPINKKTGSRILAERFWGVSQNSRGAVAQHHHTHKLILIQLFTPAAALLL